MEGAKAQRPHAETAKPPFGQSAFEPKRVLSARPKSEEEGDGLVAQAADRELENEARRSIEPLEIVHGHDYRPLTREKADHSQEAKRDRSLVGRRPFRLPPDQRNLKRPPLRGRKLQKHVIEDAFEKIAERGERQPCLSLCRRCRQNEGRALSGRVNTCPPKRRLSDPCFSLGDEGTRPAFERR